MLMKSRQLSLTHVWKLGASYTLCTCITSSVFLLHHSRFNSLVNLHWFESKLENHSADTQSVYCSLELVPFCVSVCKIWLRKFKSHGFVVGGVGGSKLFSCKVTHIWCQVNITCTCNMLGHILKLTLVFQKTLLMILCILSIMA